MAIVMDNTRYFITTSYCWYDADGNFMNWVANLPAGTLGWRHCFVISQLTDLTRDKYREETGRCF